MSLEGIFDPMVRAYFAGQNGGGSSAELAELKANGGVGYDEIATVELVPEANYEFSVGMIGLPSPQLINAGDEIVTVIDGIEYKGTSSRFGDIVCVGNTMAMGGEDTGEPYLTAVGVQEGVPMVLVVFIAEYGSEEPTQHTVSVVANTKVAHPIATKYIPYAVFRFEDFGLPFVLGENLQKTEVTEEVWLKMVDILTQPNAVVEIRETSEEGTSNAVSRSAIAWSSYVSNSAGSGVTAAAVSPGDGKLNNTLHFQLFSEEGQHTIEVIDVRT